MSDQQQTPLHKWEIVSQDDQGENAMGGANQQTIRSCFSWRGIKLPRGSLLRQTRMLRELEKVRGASHTSSEATVARMKTERHSHGKAA